MLLEDKLHLFTILSSAHWESRRSTFCEGAMKRNVDFELYEESTEEL